ncbi:hypothetical protein GCM10011608_04790 [Micromonospora sonchi]|uniref:Uncharacterized protein n=1 Tax=Micromonospora sonchi TaxID=1763543 RepID=A0A917TH49_9ACTN|nr:hypothetical protein [Micromonospora sonchi]GGM23104.1 hypothetical protein GCM10011608_04790 [Micromonospora sonchi]
MQVLTDAEGTATLVWTTDLLPHELVEHLSEAYEVMFNELVAAVNEHSAPSAQQSF